jgi:hypothetical protein
MTMIVLSSIGALSFILYLIRRNARLRAEAEQD